METEKKESKSERFERLSREEIDKEDQVTAGDVIAIAMVVFWLFVFAVLVAIIIFIANLR